MTIDDSVRPETKATVLNLIASMSAQASNLLAMQIDGWMKYNAPLDLRFKQYLEQGKDVIPIRDLRRGVVAKLNRDYQSQFPTGVPLRPIFRGVTEKAAQALGYQRGVIENSQFVPNNTTRGPAYWVKQA